MQTQPNPQAGSNQFIAKDGTPLDPTAATLTRSIRQVETQGNYTATGASGEKGAYQWMPGHYESMAKQYGINPTDFSPEAQDKTAYSWVKDQLSKGHTQSEIASMWNSGSPTAKDKVGVNSKGVKYDVPAYVANVQHAYQQFSGGTPQQEQQTPTETPKEPQTETPKQQPQDNENLLSKALDFAFPIAKDVYHDVTGKNDKSALQQVGDAGLSALWFVPGIGEGAGAAIRGTELLGEGASRLAGHALGGAATGYGADVASNLSQGKTDAGVFKPGIGTAAGGLLGGALGKLGSRYSEGGVLNSMTKENNSVLGQTKSGAQNLAESFSKDKNPGQFMASKGVNLKNSIDPETVAYNTATHAEGFQKDALALNEALTEALSGVKGSVKVADLENELLSTVPKNKPERADLIKKEMGLLKQQYGDEVSASALNEWKHRAWDFSKFDTAVPSETRKTYRTLGHTLKGKVENMAEASGLPGVGEMNDYIGSHLDAADALGSLNGTKAKGGRLGDMMKSHAMAQMGGIAGMFGGGPIGALMGAVTGHYGGKALSSVLRKIESSPIKSAILKRMQKEDPEIVQKILNFAQKKGENISPQLKPRPSKPGLMTQAATTLGSRVVQPSTK